MNAPNLRIGIVLAAIASAGGCASPGTADVRAFVLDNTEPAQLAEALSQKIAALPADDARLKDPRIATLRGLLGGAPAPAPASRTIALIPQDALGPFAAAAPAPQALKIAFAAEAASAPPAAAPTQYAVALGVFDDATLAGSVWRELAAADPLAVKGLSPRLATTKGQAGVTLLAGPVEDKDTAAGRCTAFAALGVQCAPAPFTGKALAGSGA